MIAPVPRQALSFRSSVAAYRALRFLMFMRAASGPMGHTRSGITAEAHPCMARIGR